jgi:hypothetical protein
MAYALFGRNCIPKASISVDGFLFGRPLKTTVDNDLARLMLTDRENVKVLELIDKFKKEQLNTLMLSELSKKYSTDVATFYFLQRVYQSKENKEAQDLYLDYYEKLISKGNIQEIETLKEYYIAFVPGLAYKQDTTTGADFARQRKLLTSESIENELIEIGEWDLAEDNAIIIANRLKVISKKRSKVIVVSASKGGLETAIALGKILSPEETKSIKSWINVGGILRGSPIADSYLTFPKSWLASIILWTKGKRIDVVQNISYNNRKESFKELNFPKNIKIINFIGAPLATKINNEIKNRYCSMINFGPNDGLTPLIDETTESGVIISEIGLDHYFRDKNIDKKTLALALVAIKNGN